MPFEWDDGKARRNAAKHGVTFETARTAFDDPGVWLAPDAAHSTTQELREWLIGESDEGLVVVSFTRRSAGCIVRIISARRAGRRDRRKYEALKRVSMAPGPEGDPGGD
jgi:hypothetical protein